MGTPIGNIGTVDRQIVEAITKRGRIGGDSTVVGIATRLAA